MTTTNPAPDPAAEAAIEMTTNTVLPFYEKRSGLLGSLLDGAITNLPSGTHVEIVERSKERGCRDRVLVKTSCGQFGWLDESFHISKGGRNDI